MATLLLILFLHGVFLALVLAVTGARRDPANRWLSALTVVASILLLNFYLTTSGIADGSVWLAVTFLPIWLLIAPLTFRYVQAFLRVERPMKPGWIALPPLVGAAWILLFAGPISTFESRRNSPERCGNASPSSSSAEPFRVTEAVDDEPSANVSTNSALLSPMP